MESTANPDDVPRTSTAHLIAGGITAMLMFQVFVNVGMTIGIMPITGVPLPLDVLWRLVGARYLHGPWR